VSQTQKQIANYSVLYTTFDDRVAYIRCFSGTNADIALLVFYADGAPMPPKNSVSANGVPNLYFRSSQFLTVLTLFREEKPLFVNFDTTTLLGSLTTSYEPVGEDEGP